MNAVFDGSIGNGGVTVLVVGPLALVGVPKVGLVGGVLVLGEILGQKRSGRMQSVPQHPLRTVLAQHGRHDKVQDRHRHVLEKCVHVLIVVVVLVNS